MSLYLLLRDGLAAEAFNVDQHHDKVSIKHMRHSIRTFFLHIGLAYLRLRLL